MKVYLLTVVVFIIAKVVFMWANSEDHTFTSGDVLDVVRHGLSLDLSTGLYIVIVPFLATMVSVWWNNHWLIHIQAIYFGIIAFAMALAFVADTSLYPFWGFKLDATCLQYLSAPSEATASVSGSYLMWRLLAIILVFVALWAGYLTILHKVRKHPAISAAKLKESVIYILLIPLFVIGIRGGVDESTTNIGQVYYAQNQFLNHSAINPVFNFMYSLSHQLSDGNEYQFMEESVCEELVKDIYTTESMGTDTLLNTARPDIVIILLESCGEQFANAMPRLQKLKQEGIWFSQCYGNSWRTDRGTVCTLSGYPSFPTTSVMKMPEKSRSLPSIASTLQKEGYHTDYLYGGDINFTNMRSYLIATGWEKLRWKADYTREEQTSAEWGVRDDITFKTLYEQLALLPEASTREDRYLTGFSTLSSHEPWDVPIHKLDDEVNNAFYYLDQCIDNFINGLKKAPQWQNLLVIMIADHGINHKDIDEQKPLERNNIPMLWVGGAIRSPRIINTLCNQTDLCATLLGQMQLPHDDFTFSRDVLSKTYTHPTAVHNYNNAQLLVDSTGCILYDFDAKRFTVNKAQDAENLLRINKAILQKTTNDLISR